MILTVDLNPIYKSSYNIKGIEKGRRIRTEKGSYNIAGHGLNAAQIIRKQNIKVFTTGFLGGIKGRYIYEELMNLDIYNSFTSIDDENKEVILLVEDKEVYSIIEGESPNITRKEVKSFYEKYNRNLEKFDFVCGLGRLVKGMPEEIYFDLIQMARNKGKSFILDAKGKELIYGLEAQPFMVKTDRESLEDFLKFKLEKEEEILIGAARILEKGVDLLVIDLKEEGMIVASGDKGYRLKLSNTDTYNRIGQDQGYTVAGFGIGISKKYDLATIMKLGQAMRIAYSLERDLNQVNMGDIKKVMSEIEILELDI